MPDQVGLPRITVVTPSYNQGEYLEEAMQSVLDQDYPNLEYIVLDGGSTDGSVDIIRQYANRLAFWRSERDDGQSAALQEGFGRATGDIYAWLNSDDVWEPGALQRVADAWLKHGPGILIVGGCRRIGGWWNGEIHYPTFHRGAQHPVTLPLYSLLNVPFGWMTGNFFFQPEVFISAEAYKRVGGIDTKISYAMDYDLWIRLAQIGTQVVVIEAPLAAYRVHDEQKTANLEDTIKETGAVANRYLASTHRRWLRKRLVARLNRMAYRLRTPIKGIRAYRLAKVKVAHNRSSRQAAPSASIER